MRIFALALCSIDQVVLEERKTTAVNVDDSGLEEDFLAPPVHSDVTAIVVVATADVFAAVVILQAVKIVLVVNSVRIAAKDFISSKVDHADIEHVLFVPKSRKT